MGGLTFEVSRNGKGKTVFPPTKFGGIIISGKISGKFYISSGTIRLQYLRIGTIY